MAVNDAVDNAISQSLLGVPDEGPLHVLLNPFDRLARVAGRNFIGGCFHAEEFPGDLARKPAHGGLVVDQHPRIGQGEALALGPGGTQGGGHGE